MDKVDADVLDSMAEAKDAPDPGVELPEPKPTLKLGMAQEQPATEEPQPEDNASDPAWTGSPSDALRSTMEKMDAYLRMDPNEVRVRILMEQEATNDLLRELLEATDGIL